jgi:uncharacterized repeat protein (TIGR01451 family)
MPDEGSAPTLSWSIDALPAASFVLLTYDLTVEAPIGIPGEYRNVAQVMAADQHDPDSTPGNGLLGEDDHDAFTLLAQEADLSVIKVASASRPDVGDTVTYEITLVNDGPNDATNVVVSDVVPSALLYASGSIASDAGATGAVIVGDGSSAPILRWTVDALPAGSSVTLSYDITVLAPTGAADEYLNAAEIPTRTLPLGSGATISLIRLPTTTSRASR